MKILVLSDIHDNYHNLRKALEYAKENYIAKGLFLGDFVAPPVVKMMLESEISWTACWGNNDGEKSRIVRLFMESKNSEISDSVFHELEIDGKKIFMTHYPEIAKPIARSSSYKAVFYGHNHEMFVEKLENGTLLLNPGEITGGNTGISSFAVWDSETNEAEIIEIKEPLIDK